MISKLFGALGVPLEISPDLPLGCVHSFQPRETIGRYTYHGSTIRPILSIELSNESRILTARR